MLKVELEVELEVAIKVKPNNKVGYTTNSCWSQFVNQRHQSAHHLSPVKQTRIQTCELFYPDNCIPSCDAELIRELVQCSAVAVSVLCSPVFNSVHVIIKTPELFNVGSWIIP